MNVHLTQSKQSLSEKKVYTMRFICALFLGFGILFSQNVTIRPAIVKFDTSLTTVKDSTAIWIVNASGSQIHITDINIYGGIFSIKDSSFIVPATDSVKTWIYFSSVHNLTYNDFVFVETNLSSGSIIVPISGTKKYAEALYAPTQGLSGQQLKTTLTTISAIGHTSLGYNTARDRMFMDIDNKRVNGQGASVNTLECVYTGREATGYANRSAAQTNDNFNTEHTWPQSKFSEANPMVSDIHHLFPTDNPANGKRSNFPFGVVVNSSWNVGGSKYGTTHNGQTVFEPRDEHKGDCARAMLYFIVRYPQNYGSFWNDSPYQDAVMRDWNKKFPPTAKSKARNNGVQQYQGNRNPFVDHPELVERINNFAGTATTPPIPKLVASPMKVSFDIAQNQSAKQMRSIIVANIGNGSLKITKSTFSNSVFTFVDSSTDIESNGYRTMQIQFDGSIAGTYSGTLTLEWSDGTTTQSTVFALEGKSEFTSSVERISHAPNEFMLYTNFPNPFNPSTTIGFTIQESGLTTLQIFDALGREVATLVNEELEPGIYYQKQFNAQHLSSGIYFARLTSGNKTLLKKMLLMK